MLLYDYNTVAQQRQRSPYGDSQFEISRSVNEYHRLKLRSPIRDWSVHRDSVPAGTFQIQTGLPQSLASPILICLP